MKHSEMASRSRLSVRTLAIILYLYHNLADGSYVNIINCEQYIKMNNYKVSTSQLQYISC